ncbi:SDR family oxidoreductase [Candidatus Gottesmanbacteria bacterium]|nr:SDR family oxidoreductase [Candidatus Gottesmanbacteria bacterium]
MIDTKLKDKVVLITGANHGIGAATAKAFAKEGAKVFITYLRMESSSTTKTDNTPGESYYRKQQTKGAADVLEEIRSASGKAEAWEADLSSPNVIPELFDQAEKAFGKIDILVNNAAYCLADSFIPQLSDKKTVAADGFYINNTISVDSVDKHFAVNSRATALLIAEFAKRFIERKVNWGRIISVSTDGDDAFPTEISYGASKAALVAYTRSAALELGPHGVTANIVSLGPVQTGWISPEMEKDMLKDIPLRVIGQPADVADVILFLASDQARWLTGQKIYVGGGHRML